MKTDAVICIALTRHNPTRTRLSFTAFSTSAVMFKKSIRSGTFTVRYFVCDSMRCSPPMIRLNGYFPSFWKICEMKEKLFTGLRDARAYDPVVCPFCASDLKKLISRKPTYSSLLYTVRRPSQGGCR